MSLRKELISIWQRPLKSLAHTHENFVERFNKNLELYSKLDEKNISSSHYLLIDKNCPLKNTELGCKVTYITFKQGRSKELTTAYIISDLENVGQEAIVDIVGTALIKIPDEYKAFLLSEYGCSGRNHIEIQHKGVLDWFGIRDTLIKLLNTQIKALKIWDNKSRKEYVEKCSL